MIITKPAKTYSFVPTTVAKSSEVNTNFDNAFAPYDTTGYLYDGWFALAGGSLEYNSADSVKTTADINLTEDIQVGDKVTFEQSSTEKFFTVIAIDYNLTVANRTYIQLAGTTSVANSAITANTVGFSRYERPYKYPTTAALAVYPVGSIYISVLNTNPNAFFGGTWVSFGTGRTLVGVDTGQTEFDTVEETGGAKTHTLTTNEMPSHTHTQNAHNHTQDSHNHTQNSHNHTQNAHSHDYAWGEGTGDGASGFTFMRPAGFGFSRATTSQTATNQATTATNQATTATNQATTATNQNTGGGAAHNNLQPYITVYMWKRTA
jgi:microcystin-dependent protein